MDIQFLERGDGDDFRENEITGKEWISYSGDV